MRKLIFVCLIAILATGISSCSKSEEESNATVSISNTGNNGGVSLQFVRMEITPVDASSGTRTYTFVSSPHASISVPIILPKTGSYKIKVIANNGVGYIQWNSIAMAVGGNTQMGIYCPGNGHYTEGSQISAIYPDEGNI